MRLESLNVLIFQKLEIKDKNLTGDNSINQFQSIQLSKRHTSQGDAAGPPKFEFEKRTRRK